MNDLARNEIENPILPATREVRDVTVLGLGNVLRSDDGVGVHVVRSLAMNPGAPSGLHALDCGAPGFRLAQTLIRSDFILFIDAARFGAPPGAMRLLRERELHEHVCRGGRLSAHEAGMVDLLAMAMAEDWEPGHLAFLCVQPERIEWGLALSEPVAQAIPRVCRAAIQTALSWQSAA
jgi:hydrogenase maturation protease